MDLCHLENFLSKKELSKDDSNLLDVKDESENDNKSNFNDEFADILSKSELSKK